MKSEKLTKTLSVRLSPRDYVDLVAESESYNENISDTLRRAWMVYKQEKASAAMERRLKEAIFAINAEVANLNDQERTEAKTALANFLSG
ncbi:MAG: hypothetical protein H7842_10770 [Gammaproteobacteria bacterium SHHR-1]